MIRRGLIGALLVLGACAPRPAATPAPPVPAAAAPAAANAPQPPARAADLPLTAATLPDPAGADAALAGFRRSCPALLKREDRSGLTTASDWAPVCAAAESASDAAGFFRTALTPVTVAAGAGFATGYYEPEIAGARLAGPGYAVPLYRRPPDLVEADLGAFAPDLKGRTLRGRLEGSKLVPYADRAAIMAGALAGRGLELAFAADPFEAFFLEIQGSGRLRLPDGGVMRIGYAGQNGRAYVPIGRVLIERGELPKGGANMDAILAWLRAHPAEASAVLAANPSVVFFRELTGAKADDGPVGALGVPVVAGVSVAADPAFVPLGAPLFVATTLPGGVPLAALMVAQDTGGAIRGPNRLDLFRGSGDAARAEAGALAADARVTLLLPPTAAARLLAPKPAAP